jgi:hypothetical protein
MIEYTIAKAVKNDGYYVRAGGLVQYAGTLEECLAYIRRELEDLLTDSK